MSESKEVLHTEILSHCTSLESVTDKQVASIKKDQEQLVLKIKELFEKLQEASKKLPQNEFKFDAIRINGYCSRLEICAEKIKQINKRCDKMIEKLEV